MALKMNEILSKINIDYIRNAALVTSFFTFFSAFLLLLKNSYSNTGFSRPVDHMGIKAGILVSLVPGFSLFFSAISMFALLIFISIKQTRSRRNSNVNIDNINNNINSNNINNKGDIYCEDSNISGGSNNSDNDANRTTLILLRILLFISILSILIFIYLIIHICFTAGTYGFSDQGFGSPARDYWDLFEINYFNEVRKNSTEHFKWMGHVMYDIVWYDVFLLITSILCIIFYFKMIKLLENNIIYYPSPNTIDLTLNNNINYKRTPDSNKYYNYTLPDKYRSTNGDNYNNNNKDNYDNYSNDGNFNTNHFIPHINGPTSNEKNYVPRQNYPRNTSSPSNNTNIDDNSPNDQNFNQNLRPQTTFPRPPQPPKLTDTQSRAINVSLGTGQPLGQSTLPRYYRPISPIPQHRPISTERQYHNPSL